MVPSRPPNLQKTTEKLKNPQEPNTRAPESQEGLKQANDGASVEEVFPLPESQEGLKRYTAQSRLAFWVQWPESQEGLKLSLLSGFQSRRFGHPRISRRVETTSTSTSPSTDLLVVTRISRRVETRDVGGSRGQRDCAYARMRCARISRRVETDTKASPTYPRFRSSTPESQEGLKLPLLQLLYERLVFRPRISRRVETQLLQSSNLALS